MRTDTTAGVYAKADATPRCRAARSETLRMPWGGTPTGSDLTFEPPRCGPYITEGTTTACKLDQIHLVFNGCGSFTSTSKDCDGYALAGPHPWAVDTHGVRANVAIEWNHDNHSLLVVSYLPDSRIGMAHLGGSIPGPNNASFHVDDGFAVDGRGYPHGDHFYTPDLPGQGPGDLGGPLYLGYNAGSLTDAHVYIHGYLYVKRDP